MAVLDASFLADLDRGHPGARLLLGALADEGRPLVVPTPVLLVFLAGARDPARAHMEIAARFEVVPLSEAEALRAAQMVKETKGDKVEKRWVELAAAGVALLRGEPLVTAHEHDFENVPGLEVLTYRR